MGRAHIKARSNKTISYTTRLIMQISVLQSYEDDKFTQNKVHHQTTICKNTNSRPPLG